MNKKESQYRIYRIRNGIKEYYTSIAWVKSKSKATKYSIRIVAGIAARLNCLYEKV